MSSERRLVTGGPTDQFLPHLRSSILMADIIDIAVAFVKSSGLKLIFDCLHEALTRPSPSRIRFLTSDYLGVTDPEALQDLLLLSEFGLDARLFSSTSRGFHLKAYLFSSGVADDAPQEWAYVGSSNITGPALMHSLEWNYRVERAESPQGVEEARRAFQSIWSDSDGVIVTDEVISQYRARRQPVPPKIAPGTADAEEGPPTPNPIQERALRELARSRDAGYKSGLVVMATGLGKTHLAAFDVGQCGARTVLFVAHREEILAQAQKTFQRLFPLARMGLYAGARRERKADMLFASVQTLSRVTHLDRFDGDHFDYVIVDEFHHAQAPTYRRLIEKFTPDFLLGLTATPDRTDGSDIRALCDENEVFTFNLFDAVRQEFLCPFHYYGINDVNVDYQEIPWRNGKFDPEQLENKLATIGRAEHAYAEWQDKCQSRTLAFCVSRKHADFMADRFRRKGVRAEAVHGESSMNRADALSLLEAGELDALFSVDLFSEGVDLPLVDTILMLRPTESRILFLQQLGRGLRRQPEKSHLVILDFIGNHKSFLAKPQALFGVEPTSSDVARFVRDYETDGLALPAGCFVNFDLEVIEFLRSLHSGASQADYEMLKDALQRRPTLTEYFRGGASMQRLKTEFGSWFQLVHHMDDLTDSEDAVFEAQKEFLKDLQTTRMNRSFKMVLLEAFLNLGGFAEPPRVDDLCMASMDVFKRKRWLVPDLAENVRDIDWVSPARFKTYWEGNPINAWRGGNVGAQTQTWFVVEGERFAFTGNVDDRSLDTLNRMVREISEYRLAKYSSNPNTPVDEPSLIAAEEEPLSGMDTRRDVVFFPNIPVACGHFREGRADIDEYRKVRAPGDSRGETYFIAQASGDSMSHGQRPVRDGDFLLLCHSAELSNVEDSGIYVIENVVGGTPNYVLRQVSRDDKGQLVLVANNPAYDALPMTEEMKAVARLIRVLNPLEFKVGESFTREDVPALFGQVFNPGNWNSGHVSLPDANAVVLFVTLNKQGKAVEHHYVDGWSDDGTFSWQSQRSTTPVSRKGQEIIKHNELNLDIHLFVRESKLDPGGKGAPFVYHGRVEYLKHTGSAPMNVSWKLVDRV